MNCEMDEVCFGMCALLKPQPFFSTCNVLGHFNAGFWEVMGRKLESCCGEGLIYLLFNPYST
jgi:hypothetical protein